MKQVVILAQHELNRYFDSVMAYVVLGLYLIMANALFFFPVFGPGVFSHNTASLRSYFEFAPWILMIIIPAMSMRLIADERKSGTYESLMSMPIKALDVVLSKFFAALFMLLLVFAFSLIMPILFSVTVAEGFTFDWGTTFSGYIGLIFLSATYISISLWMSAQSKEQIIAFLLSFVACFTLNILHFSSIYMSSNIGQLMQKMSPFYHFINMSRGVVDSRDLVYYLSLIIIFIFLTVIRLQKMSR